MTCRAVPRSPLALLLMTLALSSACRIPGITLEAPPRAESGRAVVPPSLDGRCGASEYAGAAAVPLEDPQGRRAGRALVLHDGLDLFVCVDGVDPAAAQRATVRLDPVVTGGSPAALTFSNGPEQRIDLSRVGGFGRSVGLTVSMDQASWPSPRNGARAGELVLGPIYRDAPAGSVFLDGRRGFLTVPDAPAIPLSGLTVEAWIRPAEGACGAILSGGANSLYLGLCDALSFSLAGRTTATSAAGPRDTGWHHVAVSADREGVRSYYVDGELVLRSGLPPERESALERIQESRAEERPMAAAQAAPAPLRIGADASAPPGEDGFRGNLRELRIWGRARTADELRTTAFTALTGKEPDLVALWPLTHDLRDLVGGHDAGIVGTAALAREAPTATSFPPRERPPPPPAYQYPPREPLPAWTPLLLASSGASVQVDGRCDDAAYATANELRLEPDRQRSVAVLLSDDALYVCAHPLPGGVGGADGLTFLVGLQVPLALHLAPNGTLRVMRPDGAAIPDLGISGKTAAAPALPSGQEDVRTIGMPWWSGELRIPWQALPGFQAGAPLRLAVMVDSSIPFDQLPADVRAGVDPRTEVRISGQWPAQFDPASPGTWGQVPTAVAGGSNALPWVEGARLPSLRRPTPRLTSSYGPWPQSSPTVKDFNTRCPTIKDTATLYFMGIKVKTIDLPDDLPYAFDRELKWPRVDPASHPMVQASGTLMGIELSAEDSPFIHTSHDLDMILWTDWNDSWLVLDDPIQARQLVLETENGGLAFFARPLPGEHVSVGGRWIFDCGHSPKTEAHPLPYFESDRAVVQPTGTGPNQKVRLVRVWLNNDPGAFTYSLQPFTFNVEFPQDSSATWPQSHGSERFVRVRNTAGAKVDWSTSPGSTTLAVTVTPASPATASYFELFIGYIDSPRSPAEVTGTKLEPGPNSTMIEKTFTTYTVTLEGIDILDDLEGKLDSRMGIRGSGKWHLDAIINDQWRGLLFNQEVDTGDSIDLSRVAPVTTLPGTLALAVTGFANDDPWKGPYLGTAAMNHYNLGDLKSLCCDTTRTFTPPGGGPWRLRYHVSLGGEVPPVFADSAFWQPRLADNDQISASLGVLHVDPSGAPQVTTRTAYITEPPLRHDNVLLDPDVDGYNFTLDDFADVQIDPLSTPLVLEQSPFYDYEGYSSMPPELQAIVGYRRNYLTIHSETGSAGDVPYTIRVTTRYKKMDPDWGAAHDRPDDGRAVDLRTPDPRAQVTKMTTGLDAPSELRALTMPWAWQHVPGETHYYRVTFPPPTLAPPGHLPCEYDAPASLSIDTGFMTKILLGDPGEDRPLTERFPSGQVIVKVDNTLRSIMGNRGVYQLNAVYNDAAWLTPKQCETVRKLMAKMHELDTPFPIGGSLSQLIRYFLGQVGPPGVPGGLPPDPGVVDVGPLGQGWVVQFGDATRVDTVVTGTQDQPLQARLYDSAGVLVGRGTTDARSGGSRLTVDGLKPGEAYVLQAVPAFETPREGATRVPMSFARRR